MKGTNHDDRVTDRELSAYQKADRELSAHQHEIRRQVLDELRRKGCGCNPVITVSYTKDREVVEYRGVALPAGQGALDTHPAPPCRAAFAPSGDRGVGVSAG